MNEGTESTIQAPHQNEETMLSARGGIPKSVYHEDRGWNDFGVGQLAVGWASGSAANSRAGIRAGFLIRCPVNTFSLERWVAARVRFN
jgi:hypothetical protein